MMDVCPEAAAPDVRHLITRFKYHVIILFGGKVAATHIMLLAVASHRDPGEIIYIFIRSYIFVFTKNRRRERYWANTQFFAGIR